MSSGFYNPELDAWVWFLFINLLLDSPIYNDLLFHIMFLKSWWKNVFHSTWDMQSIVVVYAIS